MSTTADDMFVANMLRVLDEERRSRQQFRPMSFVTISPRQWMAIESTARIDWVRETHWQRRGRILANHRTVRS